jgi:hypothetical protein
MYIIGTEGRNDIPAGTFETTHETLAEAAEVVRRVKGWAEVHLSESFSSSEISCAYAAYPTAEQRDADDYMSAPWIHEY